MYKPEKIVPMSGRQYFRALAKAGLPASLIARELDCQLKDIYRFKQAELVPAKFQRALAALNQSSTQAELSQTPLAG